MNDAADRLAALDRQGARRYDPARFHYLESLIRRGHDARTLDGTLEAFEHTLEIARQRAETTIKRHAATPALHEPMQRYYQQGDYKAVERLARIPHRSAEGSPLTDLSERLRAGDNDSAAARDLRALAAMRAHRARQHTARRIHDSIAQPIDDAGPLNAHRQLVRAMERLQRLAPDYLERFVGYVDTLMALEKAAPRKE